MKQTLALAAAFVVAAGMSSRAAGPVVRGDYIEARTAEVFTGGCTMGSEGETSGREAILAWRVAEGSVNGVALDGLSIVAVVAADVNLGTYQLGGASPTTIKSVILTDSRASSAQRDALMTLASSLAPKYVADVVESRSVPISFRKGDGHIAVSAGPANVDVATEVKHSPDCGAIQWFDPLARVDDPALGMTRSQSWSGSALGTQWKQVDRKSSFFGTFSYSR
jgi:hypothetical protein